MDNKAELTTPDATEELSAHLHRLWYAGRRIVVYRLFDISQAIVDEWADAAAETIRHWEPGYPYLALHDIAQRGVGMKVHQLQANLLSPWLTNNGRSQVVPTAKAEAHLNARVALLVSLQFSGNFARLLISRQETSSVEQHVLNKVFSQQYAALRWLSLAIP